MVWWIFLFVGLLLIVSLSKGVFELLSVYDRVELVEIEVAELEAKKISLERQLEERQGEGYIERQIRNKLHLSRPGEVIVMLPEDYSYRSDDENSEIMTQEKENWQKWMELFF